MAAGAYGVSLAAVGAAFLVRHTIALAVGPGLPPFIIFYPTVMVVALLSGMGPGMTATVLASLVTWWFIMPPQGSLLLARFPDGLSLALFFSMGLFMSVVAEMYRRARQRAAAYQRELSVNESEARFSTVFRASPISMSITRISDGHFIDANEAFLKSYGGTREDVLGHTSLELDIWESPADRDVMFSAVRGRGSVHNFEAHFRRRTGEIWAGLVSAETIEIAGEPCVWFLSQDITERIQAEGEIRTLNAELEQRVQERTSELTAANRELDAFAYAVSHDLRAPLRAMSGFSNALQEDYGATLTGEARGFLDQIAIASASMGELIDGLLRLSRSTRGDLQRDVVDLSALAERILGERVRMEPDRAVSWTVQPGLATHGDARLIEVVLTNLLDNAWKYTTGVANPTIRFHGERRGSGQVFRVTDNGAGFDMKHAARLFQPFQRLHRRDEFPGIGIGLATVQRIIHRHGGTIDAAAVPGKGATFSFTLSLPDSGEKESV